MEQKVIRETAKDKNDMVDGNDHFLRLIDEVIEYETENKRLEKNQKILKSRDVYTNKVDEIVKQAKRDLEQQLETVKGDQKKLDEKLSTYNEEDLQRRYDEMKEKKAQREEEISKITTDLKDELVKKVGLMVEKRILNNKLNFLRAGFDEELKELESQVQNEKKVISDTNKRSLDLENIIKSLEAHYAEIADRSKQEVDQLNRKKIDALRQTSGQSKQKADEIKREMTLLKKSITELQTKLEVQQTKEETLKQYLKREEGDNTEISLEKITGLEKELKKKRDSLTLQVSEHQELLNIKLGLDLEIATYGGLLENEEESFKDIHTE